MKKKTILFIPLFYPNFFFFFYLIFKLFKFGIKNFEFGIPYIDSIADGDLILNSYKYIKKKWSFYLFKNCIYNFCIFNNIIKFFLIGNFNSFIKLNKNFLEFLKIKNIQILIIDNNIQINYFKEINKLNNIDLFCSNINKNKFFRFFINNKINYLTFIKGITGNKQIKNCKIIFNYFRKFNQKNTILGFGLSNIKIIMNLKNVIYVLIGSYFNHLINKFYPFYKKIIKIIKIVNFLIK